MPTKLTRPCVLHEAKPRDNDTPDCTCFTTCTIIIRLSTDSCMNVYFATLYGAGIVVVTSVLLGSVYT